ALLYESQKRTGASIFTGNNVSGSASPSSKRQRMSFDHGNQQLSNLNNHAIADCEFLGVTGTSSILRASGKNRDLSLIAGVVRDVDVGSHSYGSSKNCRTDQSGALLYENQKCNGAGIFTGNNVGGSDGPSSKSQHMSFDHGNQQLSNLNNHTVADCEFVGVTGTSSILRAFGKNNRSDQAGASLGKNQKRLRSVTSMIREASDSGCPSSTRRRLSVDHRPPSVYKYVGKCEHSCEHCGARFCMTSLGARIDDSVSVGRGPYGFKISGQLYHWLGSLCPAEGDPPRFLQLYVYDTKNEVNNCMSYFGGDDNDLRRDIVEEVPPFKVRLYSVMGARGYELPTGDTLGAIVYESGPNTDMDYDIVIEERIGQPQRVNKHHPSYMALQFPFLFIYGEHGYSKEMKMVSVPGGPRYMYAHYLDALAICRVHGNPSYFITFTCNVKWPEIVEYMEDFPGLTTADRADIVDRVFEMKIRQFVKYLRDVKPFVVYTVEFQKRGLPHCHTLIWVDENSRIQNHEDINAFISAELSLLEVDPVCCKIVLEFMIHGPCGEICPTAACMKNSPKCAKYFPKEYCDHTYMDHDGFVHYRRRDT
nr:DNA helicase [Tanacetum cinerariifolium]